MKDASRESLIKDLRMIGPLSHGHFADIGNRAASMLEADTPQWTLTAERMPEPCAKVLAYTGKGQPIRAQWVPVKTLEDTGDGNFGEYDEATDTYYWPEAWYETNENEETHWMVDKPVTHWMPLPAPPSDYAAKGATEQGAKAMPAALIKQLEGNQS
jgi:hypothetical protein